MCRDLKVFRLKKLKKQSGPKRVNTGENEKNWDEQMRWTWKEVNGKNNEQNMQELQRKMNKGRPTDN